MLLTYNFKERSWIAMLEIKAIEIRVENAAYGPEKGSSGWSACCYKD